MGESGSGDDDSLFPPYFPPLGEGLAVFAFEDALVWFITVFEIGNGFGGLCPGGGGLFAEVGVPAGVEPSPPPLGYESVGKSVFKTYDIRPEPEPIVYRCFESEKPKK